MWWKIEGHEWKPLHGMTNARILAGAAETCAEFEEAMKE